jgi:hypothetical protein
MDERKIKRESRSRNRIKSKRRRKIRKVPQTSP